MATKRRFSWMRQFIRPEPASPVRIEGLRSWKRPYCTKCGKKIRNIKKIVYDERGRPYHKKCYEDREKNNQTAEN